MASLLKAKHQKTGLKMAEEEGWKIANALLASVEATIEEGSIISYLLLQAHLCIKDRQCSCRRKASDTWESKV